MIYSTSPIFVDPTALRVVLEIHKLDKTLDILEPALHALAREIRIIEMVQQKSCLSFS